MTVLNYRSAPSLDADTAQSRGHWLGWSIYLAMSWTWCIGMFLPVLLIRDYGIWGFVVFAVPNVLGAAAMGWVLRRPEDSPELVGAHRHAMICFSAVTVAFQFFFAAWMFYREPISILLLGTVALAAVGVLSAAARPKGPGFELTMAASTLAVSMICGILVWKGLQPAVAAPLVVEFSTGLLALSPVIVFGFLLCPYLDLTFHRARQSMTAKDSQLGFSIGFGVIFLAAICFTLVYRGRYPFSPNWYASEVVRWSLGTYFMIQLAFTAGVHLREVGSRVREHVWGASLLLVAGACAGVLSYGATELLERARTDFIRPMPPETTYRLFMGFYGLVFPAYVWLCMIPSPRAKPSNRSLAVFAVAVVVAAPMFWMGFIEGRMIWLLPGLAVVLLARIAVPRKLDFDRNHPTDA